MRTKALLLGAAIGAVGLATSMAQVYSVNVVGYVNVTIPTGYSIIANPLVATPDNTIASVMHPPQALVVYSYNNSSSSYSSAIYDPDPVYGGWNAALDCSPGIGLFVFNSGAPFTMTFVGDVKTGNNLSVPLYNGFNLVSSIVPQAGKLQTDLGYVPSAPPTGDVVYKYNNATTSYDSSIFDPDPVYGGWDVEPTLDVGQGCFIKRGQVGAGQSWTRSFTIN